jgi:predicted RNA-binding protein with PUA-like domain
MNLWKILYKLGGFLMMPEQQEPAPPPLCVLVAQELDRARRDHLEQLKLAEYHTQMAQMLERRVRRLSTTQVEEASHE